MDCRRLTETVMKKNLILIMGLSMGLSAAEPKFRQQDIDTKVGVGYGL